MFRTIRLAALAVGASLIAVPAFAADSPVVGTWATVAETEMGNFEATMTVAEASDGYSIEMVDASMAGPNGSAAPAMASTISDVKVDGSKFSFKRTIDFQGQGMVLSYEGAVDGDTLTASANSDFGAVPVKGTRQ
jgi:hypothetical protein